MLKFLKFVKLEGMARTGKYEPFLAYYYSRKFGEKYQLLADILRAFVIYKMGKHEQSESEFKELYGRILRYKYFNDDTKIYIANYIFYYTHIAHGIDEFYLNTTERPLRIRNVNSYIKYAFFHNTEYL